MNRDPWTDDEDIILLQAQLDFGNKWNQISMKLSGRSENSVKNRFNILYKKYGIKHKTLDARDVSEALNAVNEEKKADTDWIHKLIEDKCAKMKNLKTVDRGTPPLGLKTLKSSLMAMTKLELEGQTELVYPSHGYLDKMKKKTVEILARSERFINPATTQELFFSDQAIFLYNEHGYLIPFTDIHQIKRSRCPRVIEVDESSFSGKLSPRQSHPFNDALYHEGELIFSPTSELLRKTNLHPKPRFQLNPATSPMLSLLRGSNSSGLTSTSPHGQPI